MILIVSSRFDKTGEVVKGLQESCIQFLNNKGMAFDMVEVPGAVEIPVMIQQHVKQRPDKYRAVIALGCIVKGETDHYEWVMQSCIQGLTRVGLDFNIPIIHGVIPCDDTEVAKARKNAGERYAETALEMAHLLSS